MRPDTLDHPDLAALLAGNRTRDLRGVIADWLLDRDEPEAAARVLACPSPDQVAAVVAAERWREAMAAMSPAATLTVGQAVAAFADTFDRLLPTFRRVAEALANLGDVTDGEAEGEAEEEVRGGRNKPGE